MSILRDFEKRPEGVVEDFFARVPLRSAACRAGQGGASATRVDRSLAVTIWGPGLFEPATSILKAAVATEHREPLTWWEPWTRLTTTVELGGILRDPPEKPAARVRP